LLTLKWPWNWLQKIWVYPQFRKPSCKSYCSL